MRLARVRRLSQLVCIAAILALVVRNRYPPARFPAADVFIRASPLVGIGDLIETGKLALEYWPGWLVIALTPFVGRVFCGWICPVGTMIDWGRRLVLGRAPAAPAGRTGPAPEASAVALLLGVAILAAMGVAVWSWVDPMALFHRIATVVLLPVASWLVLGGLSLAGRVPGMSAPADTLALTWRSWIIPEGLHPLGGAWLVALLLAAILALELVRRRFWCRYVCPAGALLALSSGRRIVTRRVDERCTDCGVCARQCPVEAIPTGDVRATSAARCILCMTCVESCPVRTPAISFGVGAAAASSGPGPDPRAGGLTRRMLLGTVGASVASAGLMATGLRRREAMPLRPPGALPEPAFLGRCIRCMACVRVCQSNGGCLQPGSIHSDVLELWAPEAWMRQGYCEYNCNLCGQVCPTHAIAALPLPEKRRARIGMARFDARLCIPYVRSENCLVCEEHCPVPKKAIRFERKAVRLPDGRQREIKLPYVVRDLCTGCGICETRCPLAAEAGVRVVPEVGSRTERPPTAPGG